MIRKLAWSLALLLAVIIPATIYARSNRTPAPALSPISNSPIYAELWTDTPIYTQGNLLDGVACAPTAVSMIMGHYQAELGLPDPSPMAFVDQVGANKVIPGQGLPFADMVPALNHLGYEDISGHAQATPQELAHDLVKGPVVITAGVDYSTGQLEPGAANHALVVIGETTDASRVMIQDPYQGNREEVPAATFSTLWANGQNGIFVVRP